MYIRKKINRSGTTSVVVVNKVKGKYKEIRTIGTSSINQEIADFIIQGKQWIRNEEVEYGENSNYFKNKAPPKWRNYIENYDYATPQKN